MSRRKTSLPLNGACLIEDASFGNNVSAKTGADLRKAVAEARDQKWLKKNEEASEARGAWRERNDHPLAEFVVSVWFIAWELH